MTKKSYDAIVIGAGSVGVPTTYFLSKKGFKVLCLDKNPSESQGQNKAAIGGVRATHSDPAKIKICQESLTFFSNWEKESGKNIGWKKGGYIFPVYREGDEKILKSILPIQKKFNLNINWYDGIDKIRDLVPGINEEGLIGGTYSPDDGQASPLLTITSITDETKRLGAEFVFDEVVKEIFIEANKIKGLKTNKNEYTSEIIVNAGGVDASSISKLAGLVTPVIPDSHEAGISAPLEQFLGPLVVDLRPGPEGKTENFYFAQVKEGHIIFCYTPLEKFSGRNRNSISEFMPIVARRLVELIPRLKNIQIRRVWRGLYPMTPDGIPIVGKSEKIDGFYMGIGMCGQGFMMGPGVGKNLSELISNGKPLIPDEIFSTLSPDRNFNKTMNEALK